MVKKLNIQFRLYYWTNWRIWTNPTNMRLIIMINQFAMSVIQAQEELKNNLILHQALKTIKLILDLPLSTRRWNEMWNVRTFINITYTNMLLTQIQKQTIEQNISHRPSRRIRGNGRFMLMYESVINKCTKSKSRDWLKRLEEMSRRFLPRNPYGMLFWKHNKIQE